jgi:ferredoxin
MMQPPFLVEPPNSMDIEPVIASVTVDREMCQTAATCLAFHIYELDDESKAVLLTKNGSNSDDPKNVLATADGYVKVEDLLNDEGMSIEEMRALVLESAKSCPFNAIIVKDDAGNQVWPPL